MHVSARDLIHAFEEEASPATARQLLDAIETKAYAEPAQEDLRAALVPILQTKAAADGPQVCGWLKCEAMEDGSAEFAVAAQGAGGAQRAVRLSDEHRAGRYRVRAFVADRVLSRDEMQSGGHGARAVATLQAELVIVE